VHETRVEIQTDCRRSDFDYIRDDDRITDVVIHSDQDIPDSLPAISGIIRIIKEIHHVNAVRLRSLGFNHKPETFTPVVVDKLGHLNQLSMVQPLRLEIETQFLIADEITPIHAKLVRSMNNKGITVYNNTPLLGVVNNTSQAVSDLAYQCRKSGIEFHHFYVAGLGIQKRWNLDHPVSLYDVVDIATRVRREGSGREIPRYIMRTDLGEVDYGLSSTITGSGTDVSVKLLCYDLAYFKGMQPDFTWPDHVREDADGKPILPVTGLVKTTDFALS
jgi:L-lysine 2,3-aminomutase